MFKKSFFLVLLIVCISSCAAKNPDAYDVFNNYLFWCVPQKSIANITSAIDDAKNGDGGATYNDIQTLKIMRGIVYYRLANYNLSKKDLMYYTKIVSRRDNVSEYDLMISDIARKILLNMYKKGLITVDQAEWNYSNKVWIDFLAWHTKVYSYKEEHGISIFDKLIIEGVNDNEGYHAWPGAIVCSFNDSELHPYANDNFCKRASMKLDVCCKGWEEESINQY